MISEIRELLGYALHLGPRAAELEPDTPLLGALAELDSQGVVLVVTAIEEHFGFVVEDDEISAETFETLATLADFVESKCE